MAKTSPLHAAYPEPSPPVLTEVRRLSLPCLPPPHPPCPHLTPVQNRRCKPHALRIVLVRNSRIYRSNFPRLPPDGAYPIKQKYYRPTGSHPISYAMAGLGGSYPPKPAMHAVQPQRLEAIRVARSGKSAGRHGKYPWLADGGHKFNASP